ncbi:MAG: tripartite tricarboxylate transporter TctB family protein [Burkholderiaceae bacterium]
MSSAFRKVVSISAGTASLLAFVLGVAIGGGALIVLPSQTGAGSYASALSASGPGFFPLIASVLTIFAGLACLVTSVQPSEKPAQLLPLRSMLLVGLCLTAMGVGLTFIGLLPALALMAVGLAFVFGEKKAWRALLLGPATAFFIFLVFELGLKILFPRGLLF